MEGATCFEKLNFEHMPIAKNIMSGATLIKSFLQSGIKRTGSQTKKISSFSYVSTLHNVV
jgi:hypothetical protein